MAVSEHILASTIPVARPRAYNAATTRALAILTLALIAAPVTAEARCFRFQRDCGASTSTTTRSYIVNQHRQKVGDLYEPGHGRRVQIRDTSRRIIGYVERDGTVTNTSRQPVAEIELN